MAFGSSTFWHPLLYAVTLLWIGARQHALALLMHDGAHFHLFRNKRLNDVLSEVLLAWPIFITMRGYCRTHLAHHRRLNTAEDPDWARKQNEEWAFPMDGRALAKLLIADLLGLNTLKVLRRLGDLSNRGDRTEAARGYRYARIAYYLAAAAVVTWLHAWPILLLYWIVPALTWLKVIMRVRSIAEHFALERDRLDVQTRTTFPSLFDRLFLVSKYAYLHIEHHLYPGVPFHGLPRLHAELSRQPAYQEGAHLTRTYWNVLREASSAGIRGTSS